MTTYTIERDDGTRWTTTNYRVAEEQSREHNRRVTAQI